jgi:hypothetical protein
VTPTILDLCLSFACPFKNVAKAAAVADGVQTAQKGFAAVDSMTTKIADVRGSVAGMDAQLTNKLTVTKMQLENRLALAEKEINAKLEDALSQITATLSDQFDQVCSDAFGRVVAFCATIRAYRIVQSH